MKHHSDELIKKLKLLSLSNTGDQNVALISFLTSLEEIVGVHSVRVAGYAAATGRELELPEEKISNLYMSALLHDIGKLFIPPAILYKAETLNNEELEIIKGHPAAGCEVLMQVERYGVYSDIVLHHHEFFNGRGYPEGQSGAGIPILSRIIAVADAYEAMTSERPYRKGFSHREAVTRLKAGRSTQFDPDITDAFLKAIRKYSNINLTNQTISK